MSNLVAELKADHKKLVEVLNTVRTKGSTSKESLNLLLTAKSALLAHLKKEDMFLYPNLHAAAETDPKLKQTLEQFAKDMSKITEQVLAFFAKYEKSISASDFSNDVNNLISILGSRINKEENILYYEYDKINKKKAS